MSIESSFSPNRILGAAGKAILMRELGHLGIGPKLLGLFKGGRLVEYIPSRTLNYDDLDDVDIRKQIARNLAKIHAINYLPAPLGVDQTFDVIEQYLDKIDDDFRTSLLSNAALIKTVGLEGAQLLTNYNYREELSWLKTIKDQVIGSDGDIVLSLMDMNRLNCLIRDTLNALGERMVLIDYEFAGPRVRT